MQKNTILTTVTIIVFILLMLLANVASAFSDDKKKASKKPHTDAEICLEVSGNLASDIKSSGGVYLVKLIEDNKVIEQVEVGSKEKFKLNLKRDKMYTVKIEKAGFISRMVSVCTQMPPNAKRSNLYRFHFDIELFSEAFSKYFDADDIDFPIALINYDKSKGLFNYDKNYTARIQEKMHGMSSTAR